jgi:hypothetical protein
MIIILSQKPIESCLNRKKGWKNNIRKYGESHFELEELARELILWDKRMVYILIYADIVVGCYKKESRLERNQDGRLVVFEVVSSDDNNLFCLYDEFLIIFKMTSSKSSLWYHKMFQDLITY